MRKSRDTHGMTDEKFERYQRPPVATRCRADARLTDVDDVRPHPASGTFHAGHFVYGTSLLRFQARPQVLRTRSELPIPSDIGTGITILALKATSSDGS